jgi:predicted ArsR family transcriptional regulator
MTHTQVMGHLAEKVGISKKEAKLTLDELNALVVREVEEGSLDSPGWSRDLPQAQARGAHRPQSRYRRTDQDSGAHAAALHSRQGAEGIGTGRERPGGEGKTSP